MTYQIIYSSEATAAMSASDLERIFEAILEEVRRSPQRVAHVVANLLKALAA